MLKSHFIGEWIMEMHEILRFFRKKLGFTQKEILPDLDPSVYSRIESGKQELKINDLKTILNSMSLSPKEVFSITSLDEEQRKFKTLFYFCVQNLDDQIQKKCLINYYHKISSKNKNLRELSNYIAVKSYFVHFWDEIDEITPEELDYTYSLVMNKNYHQHYDFVLIRNTIRLLDKGRTDLIISKFFLTNQGQPDKPAVNDSVYYILINAISTRIYEKDYDEARRYIQLAKRQDKERKNLNYRINLKYLENLLDYITVGDYQYMERIQEYIHILKDIGDSFTAEQIKTEVKEVLNNITEDGDKNKLIVISAN